MSTSNRFWCGLLRQHTRLAGEGEKPFATLALSCFVIYDGAKRTHCPRGSFTMRMPSWLASAGFGQKGLDLHSLSHSGVDLEGGGSISYNISESGTRAYFSTFYHFSFSFFLFSVFFLPFFPFSVRLPSHFFPSFFFSFCLIKFATRNIMPVGWRCKRHG